MSLPLNQVLCGDCIEVMRGFPKESVDLVMFSPPYWGLRDYGVEVQKVWGGKADCEHEWQERTDVLGGYGQEKSMSKGKMTTDSFLSSAKAKNPTSNFCVKCGAWKGQLGLEPHPNEWISHMVLVCGEVKRVLKKSGSLYLNVGDTYFGSGVHLPHHKTREGSLNWLNDLVEPKAKSWSKIKNKGWLQPKQKLLMPSRLAIALQYEGWILRNDIIWHKPNHMPSSVKDRLTCAYEHIFHFVRARRYFYDLDAIRQPHKTNLPLLKKGSFHNHKQDHILGQRIKVKANNPLGKNPSDIIKHDVAVGRVGNFSYSDPLHVKPEHPKGKNPSDIITKPWGNQNKTKEKVETGFSLSAYYRQKYGKDRHTSHDRGKNPSDFWSINTKPFPQAHFAVYPMEICRMPILSSCPHAVCRECGKPKTRITKPTKEYAKHLGKSLLPNGKSRSVHSEEFAREGYRKSGVRCSSEYETVGWSDCGCNKGFDAGIVLDPMCGAGTTLVVAQKLGRRWIGIDLKAEYVKMAKKRLRRECSQKLTKFVEVVE